MSHSRFRHGAVGLIALLACGSVNAADEGWQHYLTLYMVGASIDGESGVGSLVADVDVGFDDILDSLEMGYMGAYRAERGPWAIVADLAYMKLEQRKNGIGPLGATRATVDADQTTFELDGSYAFTEHWSTYAGLRYWDLGTDIQIVGGGPLGETLAASGDESWVDPLIGLRYFTPLSERWLLVAKGDIGGFGVGSDFSWAATIFAGWNFSEHATLLLGFRYVDVDYEDGSGSDRFLFDVSQGGPSAGLTWRF